VGLKKLLVKLAVRLIAPKLMRALGGAGSSRVTMRPYRAYQSKPKGWLGLAARVLKKLR
jgi:hypothetical protein